MQGRHIIEAVSWGLITSVVLNLVLGLALGLAPASAMLVFRSTSESGIAATLSGLPLLGALIEVSPDATSAVGGSLYTGALGFFPLIVLVLRIVGAAQVMRAGGDFAAIEEWLLENVATIVRRAETTMVIGTAIVNATITINTAAEIAIAPFMRTLGQRFNINGYRRANILDANTSALGYIFPWGGGVLAGYASMIQLPQQFDWFTEAMLANPAAVWPYVFHGWFLVGVFLVAAWTGYGLEYVPDRQSEEVARVRISASCSRAGPSERTDRRTPSATNSPPSSQATRTVSHRFGSAIRSSRLPTPTGDSATDSFASASPSSTPTTRRAAPNCLASSTASRSRCDQRNSSWSLRPQGASVASE